MSLITKVYDFMDTRRQEMPYPPHLFRAHVHGAVVPLFEDEMTGELCDSIASDAHSVYEEETGFEVTTEVHIPAESVECMDGIKGLVQATAFHLKKTQINAERVRNEQEVKLSQMVSLSGDLRWTMHTTCQRGQQAKEGQAAVLAIFDTSKIQKTRAQLWRVKDLLKFFDSDPCFDGVAIDSYARKWSRDADEYLCWRFVPNQGLVNWVHFEEFIQQDEEPSDVFLQAKFLSSKNLGFYRNAIRCLESLTVDGYINKISKLMMRMMDHIAITVDADSFIDTMVKNFCCPFPLGISHQ